jgi:hypothetical protein
VYTIVRLQTFFVITKHSKKLLAINHLSSIVDFSSVVVNDSSLVRCVESRISASVVVVVVDDPGDDMTQSPDGIGVSGL